MAEKTIEVIKSLEAVSVTFSTPECSWSSPSFQPQLLKPGQGEYVSSEVPACSCFLSSDVSVCSCPCFCGSPTLRQYSNPRRRHSVPTGPIHQGIYWRSPILMVSLFLLGTIFAVVHHVCYSVLSGRRVGNDQEQQRVVRSVLQCAQLRVLSN
jgi:hypothetical protein